MTATPADAFAAIEYASGVHEGFRAVHAKGVVCKGRFTPAPEAVRLTRAAHVQGGEVPVTVRFSNGSGNPRADDRSPDALGMATKFYLPDGSRTDIVAITLPSFFVRTPDDFVAFTRATKPFVGGRPGPRFLLFLARHPESWRAVSAALRFRPPESYATCAYRALHAYRWVDTGGGARFVRYTWVPEAGERSLERDEAKRRARDYLEEEFGERLAREPVRFTLQLQIAAEGDPTDDPTAVWPDERERVDVGTLVLEGLDTSREREGDVLVFDPTRVTDGIELSDDPLPPLRSRAYSISVERRSGIARPTELG